MNVLTAFFIQPCRSYRNFQLAFTVLTLNFVIPAFSYTFTPEVAVAGFVDLNARLGGAPYPFEELSTHLWRYLSAANVMTLGLMCLLLQLNLRRFYPVLVPLTFMKGFAAALWLAGFVAMPEVRVFAAAALLDTLTCAAFVYFARAAHRDIAWRADLALIPRPLGSARP